MNDLTKNRKVLFIKFLLEFRQYFFTYIKKSYISVNIFQISFENYLFLKIKELLQSFSNLVLILLFVSVSNN
jgi:hypothetical protein